MLCYQIEYGLWRTWCPCFRDLRIHNIQLQAQSRRDVTLSPSDVTCQMSSTDVKLCQVFASPHLPSKNQAKSLALCENASSFNTLKSELCVSGLTHIFHRDWNDKKTFTVKRLPWESDRRKRKWEYGGANGQNSRMRKNVSHMYFGVGRYFIKQSGTLSRL